MEELRDCACTSLSALSENYSLELLGISVSLSQVPAASCGTL